jgi:anaerobic selenocysteine-containing dehydrogenase
MILTGRMNRKGGAWFHPGFIRQLDGCELPVLDNPFTPGAPTMPEVNGILGEWPCAALSAEIQADNIRAFVNFGGSIVRSFPDAGVLRPVLEKLDVLASFDIIKNETTALSTHVLPTKDQTERADISLWDTLIGSLSMMYTPPVVEPIGERRSAWWVISQLMRRMGMDVPPHIPGDDRCGGADEEMLATLLVDARCGFDEVAVKGTVKLPLELPGAWVDRHIERMGEWKLAPEALVAFWEEMRAADQAKLGQARPLCFISRRQRRKLNASLSFLGSPADIILNPVDATCRGIEHGDRVRVRTTRGEIYLTANISETIRLGVASIPHGHEVANVNELTNTGVVDKMSGMVRYTGIPIEVEPVPAQAPVRFP